ncbi:MAG: hypothetical protein AB1762_10150, partial [Gemmatimonadota bacterium]
MTRSRSARALMLAAGVTPLLIGFYAVAQPWYLDWGATTAELSRTLPGDEIIPDARSQHTRAITINVPVERVWPWLAQLGQDRGGFYSFDVLENVVGCRMPVEDYLRPDKQSWAIGDKLWMYPPDRAGGVGFATLRVLVPSRALGFATRSTGTSLDEPEDGSWSMVLEPIDGGSTRLLIRGRLAKGRSALGAAFDASVFAPMHYVMERRMMIGIRQLAEGSSRERMLNHAHVLLWTVTFVLFLVAGWRVLHGNETIRSLMAFVAGGAVFQVLTFLQPSILVGETLVVLLLALPWWPLRSHARTRIEG